MCESTRITFVHAGHHGARATTLELQPTTRRRTATTCTFAWPWPVGSDGRWPWRAGRRYSYGARGLATTLNQMRGDRISLRRVRKVESSRLALLSDKCCVITFFCFLYIITPRESTNNVKLRLRPDIIVRCTSGSVRAQHRIRL